MKKYQIKKSNDKKMEMILVMKSKNVCLLCLPVLSRGGGDRGTTKSDNTLTNLGRGGFKKKNYMNRGF